MQEIFKKMLIFVVGAHLLLYLYMKKYGNIMEIREILMMIIVTLLITGVLWIILAIIKIKKRIKMFEKNDLEEKLLMLETAKQLRLATVETAANLKAATVETAKHLKETTVETARILASDSTMKSCETLLSNINQKLDKVLTEMPHEK
jgi:predicted membrane protein